MQKLFIVVVACLSLSFASGCFVPRDFTAKLDIKQDGAYTFDYEGNLYSLVMYGESQSGEWSADKEKEFSDEFLSMFKDTPNIKSASYVGDNLFKVTFQATGNVHDDPMYMLERDVQLFSLAKDDEDDSVVFMFMNIDTDEMERSGLPPEAFVANGTIEVVSALPLESSQGNPTVSGSKYSWKMEKIGPDMPKLVFKLQ